MARKPYPSDVKDDEWAFIAPYLTLMREDAPQRAYPLRELLNGLRRVVRTGSQWRYMPHDLPPWHAVYQQSRRWMNAGVFEQMADDLRQLLRQLHQREPEPTAAILDSRTLRSTPESGSRAGYDGHIECDAASAHCRGLETAASGRCRYAAACRRGCCSGSPIQRKHSTAD